MSMVSFRKCDVCRQRMDSQQYIHTTFQGMNGSTRSTFTIDDSMFECQGTHSCISVDICSGCAGKFGIKT
jgi:hypothetical protein